MGNGRRSCVRRCVFEFHGQSCVTHTFSVAPMGAADRSKELRFPPSSRFGVSTASVWRLFCVFRTFA